APTTAPSAARLVTIPAAGLERSSRSFRPKPTFVAAQLARCGCASRRRKIRRSRPANRSQNRLRQQKKQNRSGTSISTTRSTSKQFEAGGAATLLSSLCADMDQQGNQNFKNAIHCGDLATPPAALQPLCARDQWVIWRLTWRHGRWTKPPFRPDD